MAVAQLVRRWSGGQRVVQAEGSNSGGDYTKFFSAMIFISGLMDFSDIVILCNRPNSCFQQNLKCFHDRVAMTVKQI